MKKNSNLARKTPSKYIRQEQFTRFTRNLVKLSQQTPQNSDTPSNDHSTQSFTTMAPTGDIENGNATVNSSTTLHLLDTDRFNGVNGIEITDYINNIEASVKANPNIKDEDFGPTCVIQARTRLDTKLSKHLKSVAGAIDHRPQQHKTWNWVKSLLISTFGSDNSDPNLIFAKLLSLRPDQYTVAGVQSCIADIHSHLYKWESAGNNAICEPFAAANREAQIRFWIVGILANLFPEDKRIEIVPLLHGTSENNVGRKIVDLLQSNNITKPEDTYTTMAASIPNRVTQTPQPMPLLSTPTPYTPSNRGNYTPRGNRPNRGGSRGRGTYTQQQSQYNSRQQYTPSRRSNYNNNTNPSPEQQQALDLWPSPNQCLHCMGYGHRMYECQRPAYCPLHCVPGHTLTQCNSFRQLTGINFNNRGNFFMECKLGGEPIQLAHQDAGS